ncbi:MAG: ABC transporter permease [Dehalococcoidia bacterium]|nr:ABC transporter permease [Dehalococcoidia bacterium]
MRAYVTKRLLLFIPTLLLVSILAFSVMRILPGDPAVVILVGESGEGHFTEEELNALRKRLGTDKPIHEQYGRWIWGVVQLDFGESFWRNRPVTEDLKFRFPVTLQLTVMAVIMSLIVAVPIGVLSAVRQDTWADHGSKIFTVTGVAMPSFWVGILAVFMLSEVFNWVPPLGYAFLWEEPVKNLKQLVFPAIALGYFNLAFTARVTRSAMLEVMREDYIRTARAKGLRELVVLMRHALKNAVLPVITVSGFQFAALLGGAVLIEKVFLVPGIGQSLLEAINHRDFNVIQAIVMVSATIILALNLVIDLLYGWINPRVRYS